MRLTIAIPRPPSINAMYANNPGKGSKGRFNTKRYRCWLTEAGLHLNRQLGGWVMLTGPVKAPFDLMKKHRVYKDDSQIVKFSMFHDEQCGDLMFIEVEAV